MINVKTSEMFFFSFLCLWNHGFWFLDRFERWKVVMMVRKIRVWVVAYLNRVWGGASVTEWAVFVSSKMRTLYVYNNNGVQFIFVIYYYSQLVLISFIKINPKYLRTNNSTFSNKLFRCIIKFSPRVSKYARETYNIHILQTRICIQSQFELQTWWFVI